MEEPEAIQNNELAAENAGIAEDNDSLYNAELGSDLESQNPKSSGKKDDDSLFNDVDFDENSVTGNNPQAIEKLQQELEGDGEYEEMI